MLDEKNVKNIAIIPQSCVPCNIVVVGSLEPNNSRFRNVLVVAKVIIDVVAFGFYSTSTFTNAFEIKMDSQQSLIKTR
jgi:hypothetical protein